MTFVRLMGTQHPAATLDTGEAGWTTTKVPDTNKDANGGAYGLYVWPSSSSDTYGYKELTTGSLAAIWYMDSGSLPVLSGNTVNAGGAERPFEGPAIPIKSDASGQFKVRVLRGFGSAAATLADAIDCAGVGDPHAFTMTVPIDAGGDGVAHIFLIGTDSQINANEVATTFGISYETAGSDAGVALAMIAAINGVANAAVKYGAANIGASSLLAAGTLGVSAAAGSTSTNITLTMVEAGTAGNVANVLAATNGFAGSKLLTSTFTGGAGATSGAGGSGAAINGETLGNSATLAACGLLYYQAGIAVVSGSVFSDSDDGGILTGSHGSTVLGATSTDDGFNFITGSTIAATADAVRTRMYNMSYNNTTELNSTIYFCRANHNDFNYSSNPTYLTGSKLRVKTRAADAPVTYITTVGLYSADNELLAVAKLSEPLRKDPTNELTLRVRLDY